MTSSTIRSFVLHAALAIPLALAIAPASAAPNITAVSPRGLQIGQPTTLVITGADLPVDGRVVLGAKIASQVVKPGAKPDRVEIEVTLDGGVVPDLYPLRIAGGGGISGPVVVGVDRLPQLAFGPAISPLPSAMHGAVGGAQVVKASLSGEKGQRLILDVEAQRLGSGLKPVVRLYDPKGTQIAWSPPRPIIGGDARLETTLPASGEFTIEVHDQLFRPTGPGFFRLKAGDLQYADLAFPLGVSAGSKQAIDFASSNLQAGSEIDATGASVPGDVSVPVPPAKHFTGAAPRALISDFPELVEAASIVNGKLQELPPAPAAISGTLLSAGEEDKYLLAVAAGQKLRFEVVARQFGSPLDGVLAIQDEQGKQLASGDDRPGSSDPSVDYTVPEKVSKLVVALKDLLGRGGREFVYRIAVKDTSQPEFALSLAADRINVAAGGTQVVPVQVARTNYNGPIQISLEPAFADVALQGNVIGPGATIGLLTLSAREVSPQPLLVNLIGRALEAQPMVARRASFGEFPGSRYRPRLKSELGLAITRPSPISLAWLPGDNDQLFLGSKLPARVQFTRQKGTQGKVRLKLLTSQPTPKKAVNQGKAAAPQERMVDDVERTLRLEGTPTFGPEQKDVTVNILVPSDLPKQPWDLVLVAELLSADGKNVESSIAAPVRTLLPVAPFSLALSGPKNVQGLAGVGEAGKLVGKIQRSTGYAEDIIVTLEGLPKGYVAPQVLVPSGRDEFELSVRFPYSSKAGKLRGAKLVAASAPLTLKSVRSDAIGVGVEVSQGEKPKLEAPKEVYEDDEKFVTMINEGDGRAIPDQRDKYSGTYSMRIAQDQKYNPKLSNLGVKIRENPGPGEFRYIRFAWKKVQGNSICFSLAHDGKFGPAAKDAKDSGRPGAKFRYHAGSGGECYDGSLAIADKVPTPRFELVTRDLYMDFGEFTLTGLGFAPIDGQSALFDHIYLARQLDDFELIGAKEAKQEE